MLGYLRDNTGNWIIKIFLGIIVIVFVFLGVGSFGSKNNDSVASIGDEQISIKAYQQAYRRILNQVKARFGNNLSEDILKSLNLEQQALSAVVDERLILMQAEQMGIVVSEAEIAQSVMKEKAFHKDGRFDMELYKKVLRLNSLTPEAFEASRRLDILQNKVRQVVLSAVNVSDLEAADFIRFQNTKIAVDYLRFDPAALPAAAMDEAALKAFFDKNKKAYQSEPMVKAVFLKFSPQEHQARVSAEDVEEYYRENESRYETPEKAEARHILIRVAQDAPKADEEAAFKRAMDVYKKAKTGQDFAELAKLFSEGPTKDNGGYLGTFERATMVKPFGDKVFSMAAGEISEPVRTRFGWHVIKVVSRLEASKKTLDEVREEIARELELKERQNLAYYQADEAFESVVDGDDMDQVARIIKKTAVTTPAFTLKGDGLSMENKAGFARAAFALSLDEISDVQQVGQDYYLIKVIQKIEPALQDLAVVRERVVADFRANQQKMAARKNAEALLAKAGSAESLSALAKGAGLEVKTTQLFTRNGFVEAVGNSPAFMDAAFGLTEAKAIHPQVIETAQGFFIIALNRIQTPGQDDIQKQLPAVKKQIAWQKQNQAFQSWLAQLRDEYKVMYNPDMLK